MKNTGIAMILAFAVGMISNVTAQKHERRHQQIDVSELKEELDLTEEQTHKILEARTASSAKMKVLRADENLSKEEKRTQARAIRKENKAVLDEVLTEEQKAKSKALRKEKAAKRKEEGKAKRDRIKTLRSEFNSQISSEDKAELERLRKVLKQERVKGANKRKSAEEREKFKADHKEDFEALDALSEKYSEDVTAFLKSKKDSAVDEKKDKKKAKGKRKGKEKRVARFLLMPENSEKEK